MSARNGKGRAAGIPSVVPVDLTEQVAFTRI